MKKSLKILFLGLFLCIILVTVGCWDRQELDTLAIVTGMGIDQGEEDPQQVQVTVQILKPAELQGPASTGSGGGGGQSKPYLNVTNTAATVFDAVREFTHIVDRRLYFSHSSILVIGEKAAQSGIQSYMDLFFRDPEARLIAWVVVTKGKAGDVFETQAKIEQLPALNISQLIEARFATSEISAANVRDVMERLMSKTTAPIATLAEVKEQGEQKIVELVGTAVFKRDKMVGTLDKTETRGMLWVLGRVASGILVVTCPQCNDDTDKASLEIIKANGKIIPELKDGTLEITVKIKEVGNLGSQMCRQDTMKPSYWEALEKEKAQVIQQEVKAALKKAQNLNADIFGFGDAVHKKYPTLWKKWEAQWDEIFPKLKVNVSVEAKLQSPGMITKPAIPESAGNEDAT